MLVRQLRAYVKSLKITTQKDGPIETFFKDRKDEERLSFAEFQKFYQYALPEIGARGLDNTDFQLVVLLMLGGPGFINERLYNTLATPEGANYLKHREKNLLLVMDFFNSEDFKKQHVSLLQGNSRENFIKLMSTSKLEVETKAKSTIEGQQAVDAYLDNLCDYFIAQQIMAGNQKFSVFLQKILSMPLAEMKGRYLEAVNACLELQKKWFISTK